MREDAMASRRTFVKKVVQSSVGVACFACGVGRTAAQSSRRLVTIGGRRVRTVDVHAHASVPVLNLVRGTALKEAARRQIKGRLGFPVGAARVADMNRDGIDVQVTQHQPVLVQRRSRSRPAALRPAEREARRGVPGIPRPIPGECAGITAVSGACGRATGRRHEAPRDGGAGNRGSVVMKEIAAPEFDPFWKKDGGTAGARLHPPGVSLRRDRGFRVARQRPAARWATSSATRSRPPSRSRT